MYRDWPIELQKNWKLDEVTRTEDRVIPVENDACLMSLWPVVDKHFLLREFRKQVHSDDVVCFRPRENFLDFHHFWLLR